MGLTSTKTWTLTRAEIQQLIALFSRQRATAPELPKLIEAARVADPSIKK
jgi:hypothetical protein